MVGPASEHAGGTRGVSSKCVGQTDGKLGQPLPQVPLGVRGCLPGGFQDLVGMEGQAFVQESLSLNQSLGRREDELVGNTDNS